MPRKKTAQDNTVAKKAPKKNIIDSMIKNNENDDNNDVIIQLAIPQAKINNIINNNESQDAKILIPTPYESQSYFSNDAENISYDNEYHATNTINQNVKNSSCFWCCHSIEGSTVYSMPYNYDALNDNYFVFGSFCSLQCANAYNFATHGSSDKVWEINSWIQMLAKRYGFSNIIRPAPSRYLLKMFGGNLSIEEFREAHLKTDKTYILNIPPMISINTSSEILNTSYLAKLSENKKNKKCI
jgi:hypothetical protein